MQLDEDGPFFTVTGNRLSTNGQTTKMDTDSDIDRMEKRYETICL